MKKLLFLLGILICMVSCTDETITDPPGEAGILNLQLSYGTMTKGLAELGSTGDITVEASPGLKNLGLYIYYEDEYKAGRLENPYICNMECTVDNGRIVPLVDSGQEIYIYDKMTVVVFYPYNAEMSEVDNYFHTRADEENYPITRQDYSEQTYIPYRGQVTVNPTNSFYAEVRIYPKKVFKMEVILAQKEPFTDSGTDVKILPALDPVDNDDLQTAGKRERWYDIIDELDDQDGSGSFVRRYVSYIWQHEEQNPMIKRNDVLLENGTFTLLATEDVNIREQFVYRYGYNFSTGESFIPTSSYLINDATSLQQANMTDNHCYQVCDIDASFAGNWKPLTIVNSTYDGGGHKITNLSYNGSDDAVGLFRQIVGESYIKNVNLVDPVIEVNAVNAQASVGALVGRVNNELTAEEIQELYNNILLPDNLSEVVKQALREQLLADIYNSQSQVIACRVENPEITVNGVAPRVGGLSGTNGERSEQYDFKGVIWDSYVLGGSITVNENNHTNNDGAYIGGFCGLNEYFITRSYATITDDNLTAEIEETVNDGNGGTTIEIVDISNGFTHQGTQFSSGEGAGVDDCYAMALDNTTGVTLFADNVPSGWVTYTGIWPINTTGWTSYAGNSFWYSMGQPASGIYPSLQWERR